MTIEEFVLGNAFPNVASFADTYLQPICWIDKDKGITFTVHPKDKDGNRIVEGIWHTKDTETGETISLKGKVCCVSAGMRIDELSVEKYPPADEQTVYVSLADLFKDER